MTKFVDADVSLTYAEPLISQDAPEIHRTRASFIAADAEDDAERLDVVAGSEFLDDRIRLAE